MITRRIIVTCLCMVFLLVGCVPSTAPVTDNTTRLTRTPAVVRPTGLPFESLTPPVIATFTPFPAFPELSATLACPSGAAAGDQIGRTLEVAVINHGQGSPGFFVDLILSSDTTVPVQYAAPSPGFAEDMLLGGGRKHVDSLGAGSSMSVPFPGNVALPADTPDGDYYLGVVVDPGDQIPELKEENNVALCPIQICPAMAPMLYITLEELSGSNTGFGRMTLTWGWEEGLPPQRLRITVYRWFEDGWDNIMPNDEPYEVESPETAHQAQVTIWRAMNGKYRVVFTANYSCDREREYVHEETVP